MKNRNDISQDDQDQIIDQNLREAYGQIQFRDEWAERVLRRIALESDLQELRARSSVSQPLTERALSRLPRRTTFVLAATIVLAAAGAYWVLTTPHRAAPNNSVDSEFAKQITPAEEMPELQDATYSLTERPQQIDSVTATPGYLASKLTDDSEFEIYLVLPKNSANKF